MTGWLLMGMGQRARLVGPLSEVTQAWVQILAPPLESYFISRSLSLAIKQGPRRCCEFTTAENGGCYCCCHHPPGGSLPSFPQHVLTTSFKIAAKGASLVAQSLRICLPMQGTWVRALVWEDPTCRGATRPVSHNY